MGVELGLFGGCRSWGWALAWLEEVDLWNAACPRCLCLALAFIVTFLSAS